jgi:glycosyltransferase involved in cell wall biosynthesis
MKIAFYCPNKPLSHEHPSGDLTIALGLWNALNDMGHECREIVQFRARWFWKSSKGWLQAFSSFLEAHRNARQFHPDLWLTYHTYYKSPDLIGPPVCYLEKVPYVLFQPMYSTKRRKRFQSRLGFTLNRLALKKTAAAFTNNLNDLGGLRRVLGSDQITYLPSGIVPEDFHRNQTAANRVRREYGIPSGATVLMTAARFRPGVKYQSLEYLFRSLTRLRGDYPEMILLIVGDGPMEEHLKALATKLLPGQAIFTGRVARKDMAQYYSAADLFVFPGIGESLGMVYLEAQACGLPVVALDSPGVSQVVISGRTGLLVGEDDEQAMAEAIRDLLRSPEMRKKLGEEGIKYVKEHRNVQRNYQRLSQKLEEVVRDFAQR